MKLFMYNQVLFMIQIITTSHLYHDLGRNMITWT